MRADCVPFPEPGPPSTKTTWNLRMSIISQIIKWRESGSLCTCTSSIFYYCAAHWQVVLRFCRCIPVLVWRVPTSNIDVINAITNIVYAGSRYWTTEQICRTPNVSPNQPSLSFDPCSTDCRKCTDFFQLLLPLPTVLTQECPAVKVGRAWVAIIDCRFWGFFRPAWVRLFPLRVFWGFCVTPSSSPGGVGYGTPR